MDNGRVVKSAAGHDKDRFYMVVESAGDYAFIADGKLRKLASPKRKNVKHLKPSSTVLDISSILTDKRLREALKPFNDGLKAVKKSAGEVNDN